MPEPPSPAPPDVRLVSLRLGETARHIRDRLASQSQRPGVASRAWPWIRASLGGELDVLAPNEHPAVELLATDQDPRGVGAAVVARIEGHDEHGRADCHRHGQRRERSHDRAPKGSPTIHTSRDGRATGVS